MTTVRYASFFSGIAGFELAMDAAGHERVFSCEIDPRCRKIFNERFGHEPEGEDIRSLKAGDIPEAELWCAGFPCQDLSVAGRRGGITADRSGLVWKLLELAEVRRPHFLLLENVPGLLSSNRGGDFGLLLRRLADLGYVGCWRVLDAQWFGVPQRRRRVFVVASLGADCPLEVLFEPQGSRGNPAKGEEKGKIASGDIARSVGGVGGGQDYGAGKGTLVASAVTASAGHHGYSSARGDGTDNLVAYTLLTDGGRKWQNERDNYVIAEALTADSNQNSNMAGLTREDDTNLVTEVVTPDRHAMDKQAPTVTARMYKRPFTDPANDGIVELSPTTVRRLTPTEAERLQGFPDGWTCTCGVRPDCPDRRIPPWVDPSKFRLGGCGHSACGCTCRDSPRYKALGNAVAVPVVRWIADRLKLIRSGGSENG